MLQALLGAIILMGVYKYMNSKSEYQVDWGIAFMFILVPAVLLFLINMGLAIFELPKEYLLLGYILYFLVPFLFLKLSFGYETKPAFKYSIVVPIVAVLTEIPFVILLGVENV